MSEHMIHFVSLIRRKSTHCHIIKGIGCEEPWQNVRILVKVIRRVTSWHYEDNVIIRGQSPNTTGWPRFEKKPM